MTLLAAPVHSKTVVYLCPVLNKIPTRLLGVLLFASCSNGGDAVTLRLNLPADEVRPARLTVSSVASLRIGAKADLHLDMVGDMHQVFGQEADGLTPVTLNLDSLNLDFRIEQGIIKSSDIEEAMDVDVSSLEEGYAGRSVVLVYDHRARVQRIEGLEDDLSPEIIDSLTNGLANVEKLLGGDFFERLAGFFAVLPEEAVRPGDEWKNDFRQEILGLPVILENEYRFAERENGLAHIDVSGSFATDTLRIEPGTIEFPFEGFSFAQDQISVLLKGTQTGRISVDETTGWTRESNLQQKFSIEFRMGLITLPVTLDNTIRLEPR